MRKKAKNPRFDLRRETVRMLAASDLADAHGGLPDTTISNSTLKCTFIPTYPC